MASFDPNPPEAFKSLLGWHGQSTFTAWAKRLRAQGKDLEADEAEALACIYGGLGSLLLMVH